MKYILYLCSLNQHNGDTRKILTPLPFSFCSYINITCICTMLYVITSDEATNYSTAAASQLSIICVAHILMWWAFVFLLAVIKEMKIKWYGGFFVSALYYLQTTNGSTKWAKAKWRRAARLQSTIAILNVDIWIDIVIALKTGRMELQTTLHDIP